MKRLLITIAIFCSCNSSNEFTDIYTTSNCDQKFRSANIKEVVNNISSFNSQYIELTGYYHVGIEESVISFYPKSQKDNENNTLWVDFEPTLARISNGKAIYLVQSLEAIKKIDGKKVLIKGMIRSKRYTRRIGLIEKVCYLKVLNE